MIPFLLAFLAVAQPLPPSLGEKIALYLASEDSAQSEALLNEIEREAPVLSEVERLLKAGKTFLPQPTGSRPSQKLTLAGEAGSFGLYVPKEYRPDRAWSLIICLHGAGFDGDTYLERWQARLNEEYLLACPSEPRAAWWTARGEHLVMAVLREMEGRFNLDPDRIFLTGMSNGGIGTLIIGIFQADRFAALSPMAAALPEEIFPFLDGLKQTPSYIIHGSKDQVMPVEQSERIVEQMKKAGVPVVFRRHDREHPVAGGHYFPREELPALLEWFGKQRRQPYPKEIVSVRDADHLSPFFWIAIEEAGRLRDGFARIAARITGNRIEVKSDRVGRFILFLNRSLVDLSRPVRVEVNGVKRFEGIVPESVRTMLVEAKRRRDRGMLFSARLPIEVAP